MTRVTNETVRGTIFPLFPPNEQRCIGTSGWGERRLNAPGPTLTLWGWVLGSPDSLPSPAGGFKARFRMIVPDSQDRSARAVMGDPGFAETVATVHYYDDGKPAWFAQMTRGHYVEVEIRHQDVGPLFGPDGLLKPEIEVWGSWVYLYPAPALAMPDSPAAEEA